MKYIYILLTIVFMGCSGGLEPPKTSFLSGTITYVNGESGWFGADSVKDVRVIAFKNFPPADFIGEVLSGEAYFTESLPIFVDSSSFSIEINDAPIDLLYISVVLNYGSLFEWMPIGVYTRSGNNSEHSNLLIESDKIYNIEIDVDFNNLPPNPIE